MGSISALLGRPLLPSPLTSHLSLYAGTQERTADSEDLEDQETVPGEFSRKASRWTKKSHIIIRRVQSSYDYEPTAERSRADGICCPFPRRV